MKTAFSIDWVRSVAPFDDTIINIMRRVENYFPAQSWREPSRMMKPYTSGKECDYCTVMYHPDHADFGVCVEMTGIQLSQARFAGYNIPVLIELMERDSFRPTRIDLAIDILDGGARPKDVYAAWSAKKLSTPARKATIVQGASEAGQVVGETVYIGSRQSPKFLRVYDKAKEQRKPGDWVRVELELKEGHAKAAAKAIVQTDERRATLAYLRSVISMSEIEWLEQIFEGAGELIEVEKLGRKETDFERWFWKVILPAVEKAIETGVPDAKRAIERILEHTSEPTHGPARFD